MSFDRRVEVAELASSGGRSSHGAQTDSSSAAQISSMTAPIAAADSAVPSPYLMHLLASNNEQALKRAKLANAAAACAAIGSYNGAGKAADGTRLGAGPQASSQPSAPWCALYEPLFDVFLAGLRGDFRRCGWGDAEVARSRALPLCERSIRLDLSLNPAVDLVTCALVQRSPPLHWPYSSMAVCHP